MSRRICLAVAGAVMVGMFIPFAALAGIGDGIANTAHDFTASPDNTMPIGLCTFCHTPHRAQQTKLLWNHTLSSLTYSWDDTTETTNGTPLPTFDASWEGVSKNCLSCHDGTVAIGDVAWFNEAPRTGIDRLSAHTHDEAGDPARITFANPGTGDMSGNHPVAHPYPFNGAPSTYNSVAQSASIIDSGWVLDPTANGIRLFNDDGTGHVTAGPAPGQTGIECSSCHDPHNGPQVLDDLFLRGTLTGNDSNYICLKCHDK